MAHTHKLHTWRLRQRIGNSSPAWATQKDPAWKERSWGEGRGGRGNEKGEKEPQERNVYLEECSLTWCNASSQEMTYEPLADSATRGKCEQSAQTLQWACPVCSPGTLKDDLQRDWDRTEGQLTDPYLRECSLGKILAHEENFGSAHSSAEFCLLTLTTEWLTEIWG